MRPASLITIVGRRRGRGGRRDGRAREGSDDRRPRKRAGGRDGAQGRAAAQRRRLAGEGGAAQGRWCGSSTRPGRHGGRQARVRRAARPRTRATPRRRSCAAREQPDVWSPAGTFWGRLLNLQSDKPYVGDDEPVDRAHAAGDRHVGADGPGARLAGQAGLVRGHPPPGHRAGRLGGRGQAGVRPLQVRAHEPGLVDLGRRGGGRLLLRVRGQAGGADRRRTWRRRRRRSRRWSGRSSTTATRRCSSRTSCARAGSAYASAAAMEETTVIDFNRRRCSRTKLVVALSQGGVVRLATRRTSC